jgi:hypothetical protein
LGNASPVYLLFDALSDVLFAIDIGCRIHQAVRHAPMAKADGEVEPDKSSGIQKESIAKSPPLVLNQLHLSSFSRREHYSHNGGGSKRAALTAYVASVRDGFWCAHPACVLGILSILPMDWVLGGIPAVRAYNLCLFRVNRLLWMVHLRARIRHCSRAAGGRQAVVDGDSDPGSLGSSSINPSAPPSQDGLAHKFLAGGSRKFQRIVELLMLLFLAAHLMACFFYLAARTAHNKTETWAFEEGLWRISNSTTLGDVSSHNVYDLVRPLSYCYLRSLYWAVITMVTVGFGDIVPFYASLTETLVTVVTMYLSILITCSALANLTTLVVNLDSAGAQKAEIDAKLNKYSTARRLSESMRNKLSAFFDHQELSHENKASVLATGHTSRAGGGQQATHGGGSVIVSSMNNPILSLLPPTFRYEICYAFLVHALQSAPGVCRTGEALVGDSAATALFTNLVMHMVEELFCPHDAVVHQGLEVQKLWILSFGKADRYSVEEDLAEDDAGGNEDDVDIVDVVSLGPGVTSGLPQRTDHDPLEVGGVIGAEVLTRMHQHALKARMGYVGSPGGGCAKEGFLEDPLEAKAVNDNSTGGSANTLTHECTVAASESSFCRFFMVEKNAVKKIVDLHVASERKNRTLSQDDDACGLLLPMGSPGPSGGGRTPTQQAGPAVTPPNALRQYFGGMQPLQSRKPTMSLRMSIYSSHAEVGVAGPPIDHEAEAWHHWRVQQWGRTLALCLLFIAFIVPAQIVTSLQNGGMCIESDRFFAWNGVMDLLLDLVFLLELKASFLPSVLPSFHSFSPSFRPFLPFIPSSFIPSIPTFNSYLQFLPSIPSLSSCIPSISTCLFRQLPPAFNDVLQCLRSFHFFLPSFRCFLPPLPSVSSTSLRDSRTIPFRPVLGGALNGPSAISGGSKSLWTSSRHFRHRSWPSRCARSTATNT